MPGEATSAAAGILRWSVRKYHDHLLGAPVEVKSRVLIIVRNDEHAYAEAIAALMGDEPRRARLASWAGPASSKIWLGPTRNMLTSVVISMPTARSWSTS
jgi:hypothetical protein